MEKLSEVPGALRHTLEQDLKELRGSVNTLLHPQGETDSAARIKDLQADALEALRMSEKFNRQLVESSSDSIKVLDVSGHLLSINSGGLHLLEAENASAVIGRKWVTFWHKEDRPRVQAAVEAACGGQVSTFQAARKSFQGKELWWDVVISPIRGVDDRVERLLVVSRDITQRKRAEDELKRTSDILRESEERFRAMADGTPVLMWVHSADGRLDFVNRAWTDYFGVTLDDVKGTGWMPLIHPDDAPNYIEVFRKCTEEHAFFHAQARVRTKDGRWQWIDSYAQPRFSESGEFLGMAGSSIDITERVETEAALVKAHNELINERNLLSAIMGSLPVGLAVYDKKGRLTQSNESYEAVWGSPRPPVDSMDDYDLYQAWWVESGERIAPDQWASAKSLLTGQPVIGQYLRIQRFDGSTGYIINSGAPVRSASGEIIGGVVTIMDITRQKRLELERQEVQMKMEVQRRLMDQREKERQGIARDIHDGPIQTLASTAFNIQFVKESFPDPTLSVELNQIALNVKSAVRELREVVNDLRPPSIIRFGLTRAIMMHAEDLRERYPETELELYLDEDSARLSDQASLTIFRVFQEGMNNIFRHAGATKVQVKYTITGAAFALELRDNGSGFAVPKDFTNLTIDGHYGLAGMKERVESVGGTFTIASEPGKGTTITVKGPLIAVNVK